MTHQSVINSTKDILSRTPNASDEHVDSSNIVLDPLGHVPYFSSIRKIALICEYWIVELVLVLPVLWRNWLYVRILLPNFIGCAIQRFLILIDANHRTTALCKFLGERFAQAWSSTCHLLNQFQLSLLENLLFYFVIEVKSCLLSFHYNFIVCFFVCCIVTINLGEKWLWGVITVYKLQLQISMII